MAGPSFIMTEPFTFYRLRRNAARAFAMTTDPARKTVFTRIIAGELPCARVFEDDTVFAFMDAGQLNPGHVLVAPTLPYETFMDAAQDSDVDLVCAAHTPEKRGE